MDMKQPGRKAHKRGDVLKDRTEGSYGTGTPQKTAGANKAIRASSERAAKKFKDSYK